MENLPVYIPVVFGLTTLLTVVLFYKASQESKLTAYILLAWLMIQAKIASSGFYQLTQSYPPRFLLLILPPLIVIAGLFATPKGRKYIDNMDLQYLTILHVIRVPVEIVLL